MREHKLKPTPSCRHHKMVQLWSARALLALLIVQRAKLMYKNYNYRTSCNSVDEKWGMEEGVKSNVRMWCERETERGYGLDSDPDFKYGLWQPDLALLLCGPPFLSTRYGCTTTTRLSSRRSVQSIDKSEHVSFGATLKRRQAGGHQILSCGGFQKPHCFFQHVHVLIKHETHLGLIDRKRQREGAGECKFMLITFEGM